MQQGCREEAPNTHFGRLSRAVSTLPQQSKLYVVVAAAAAAVCATAIVYSNKYSVNAQSLPEPRFGLHAKN